MNGKGKVLRGAVLNVPFSEKSEAKELGAWWDPEIKKWFVPEGIDVQPFKKWMQDGEGASVGKRRSAS